MSGTLYIIGTPIGNLEDITMRQLRLLEEVDFIAAEDTRVTRKLLSHFDIHTPALSYHEHSGQNIAQNIVKQLEKMYDVKTVKVMKRDLTVTRELLLIKINNVADKRQDIMSVVDVFRAKITDYSPEALVIEIRGESSKINAFIELLEPYGILEMCRTGLVALERGGSCLKDA